MELIVNGETQRFPEGTTVMQLLEKMALTDRRLAVEVNLEIVPRSLLPNKRKALRAGASRARSCRSHRPSRAARARVSRR